MIILSKYYSLVSSKHQTTIPVTQVGHPVFLRKLTILGPTALPKGFINSNLSAHQNCNSVTGLVCYFFVASLLFYNFFHEVRFLKNMKVRKILIGPKMGV